MIRSYRDLHVWQSAIDLVVDVYRFSEAFPKYETYGLRSQLREAAVSVPANIAEGHGREYLGDYLYHLSVTNGSVMELETHCIIAQRLRYGAPADLPTLLERAAEIGRMLAGLHRAPKRRRGLHTRHVTPDT
jgi:four helix bundle protein